MIDFTKPTPAASGVLLLTALATSLAVAKEAPVDIPTVPVTERVVLQASADADVQGGAPDVNYGDDALVHVGQGDKTIYLYFDVSALPQGATIDEAQLVMTAAGSGNGPNPVTLGGVQQRWSETEVTFANQPTVAWTERTRDVDASGRVRWNVKPAVAAWVAGEHRNFGLALRGDGPIWAFRSREAVQADERPTLRIRYTTNRVPAEAASIGSRRSEAHSQ